MSDDQHEGTYVSVRYSKSDSERLYEIFKTIIDNPYTPEHLHTTLMYSRETPFIDDIRPVLVGKSITLWNPRLTLFGDDHNVLVMEFDSPVLQQRHKELKQMGLMHSYDEFRPHITLTEDYRGSLVDVLSMKNPFIDQTMMNLTIRSETFEPVKEEGWQES